MTFKDLNLTSVKAVYLDNGDVIEDCTIGQAFEEFLELATDEGNQFVNLKHVVRIINF